MLGDEEDVAHVHFDTAFAENVSVGVLLASLAVVVLQADAILDAADLEDHAGFVLLVAAGLADN